MPMLAVVELPSITGIPADSVTNSWAVAGPTPSNTAGAINSVVGAFNAFYNAATGVIGIGTWISPTISRVTNACTLRLYDLTANLGEGDLHGSPMAVSPFTLSASSVPEPLPEEVAVVLTIEGEGRSTAAVEIVDPTPEPRSEFDSRLALKDRPKQRRTGRVFIGPLNQGAVQDVADIARPHTSMRDDILAAAVELNDNLTAINPVEGEIGLGVWSRVDATVRFVEAFSMDNSFDTQRRRGNAPTSRTRVTV